MRLDRAAPRLLEADTSLAAVSFGDELKTGAKTTCEFLDVAAMLGFQSVELCDLSIRNTATITDELRARGLGMPSVALRNDFTGDAQSTVASVDHIRSWLRTARMLGCRLARVWTGWRRRDTVARRQIVDAFDQVVEDACALGVALAVETHGGLSNDLEFLVGLCSRYPRQTFGVCLDFGNLPVEQRVPLIRRLAPLTTHVHVKSYRFNDHGEETTVPLAWAITQLDAAGFRGQWVIEYEGCPPYEEGIERTVAVLRRTLGRPDEDVRS